MCSVPNALILLVNMKQVTTSCCAMRICTQTVVCKVMGLFTISQQGTHVGV